MERITAVNTYDCRRAFDAKFGTATRAAHALNKSDGGELGCVVSHYVESRPASLTIRL
jgi:hypothetical protein